MSSINPLFSLVEAAQLVGSHQQKAPFTASVREGQQVASSTTHEVSDDDQTIASRMIALRENHLMALRAAATNAGLTSAVPSQTAPLPSSGRRVSMAVDDSSGGKEIFPMKLHTLLSDPAVQDVICWLPQGKSFVVLRPDVFASRVLPQYFAPEGSNSLNARSSKGKNGAVKKAQGVHKYPSFTRKLNRWGFRQISRGPDSGAFCHDLFQRDAPKLCRGMVCQKSRKSKQAMERQSVNSDVSDLISLSSVSTKSTAASGDKNINCSAAVTVSTAGVSTSSRTLPFKKRRSFHSFEGSMDGDIPSVVSHRNSSSRRNASFPTEGVPEMVAKARSVNNGGMMVEAAAKEALARHFHEQHRAFAISSLMENSRLAMEAAGLKVSANERTEAPSQVVVRKSVTTTKANEVKASKPLTPILGATTDSAVFAPTVPHLSIEQSSTSHSAVLSSAAAAKDALMKAYMQALNGTSR